MLIIAIAPVSYRVIDQIYEDRFEEDAWVQCDSIDDFERTETHLFEGGSNLLKTITLTDEQYRILVEILESISDGHHQQSDDPCDEDDLLKAIEVTAESFIDTR